MSNWISITVSPVRCNSEITVSLLIFNSPTGKTSFLELSRQMRQEMGHALENKHQFLCQKFNAEFDWNSAEWGNATRRNHNHGGTIKFENIGKYRYGTSHKLRKN